MTRTLLILLIGGLLLAGCQDPPRGDTGGRIDPYETTKDERYSTGANIAALLEFSDETAAKLARDLAEIPEIKESSRKVVLELGGINNQTHTPSSDFEMMQQRVRSHLMRSQLLRDHFLIVESRSRMNRELERVQAAPSQQSGGQTAQYSADDTYVLLGDFYEATREDRSQYFFSFTLTHLASRALVYQNTFDLGQQ